MKIASNEDRISALPDALLHNILSFLETVEVGRTCVLSKRWRDVWTSHPYLDFNFETFVATESEDELVDEDEKEKKRMVIFNDFISQVLIRRNYSNIVKLCFNFKSNCYPRLRLLESSIYYAVKHHVEKIDISINCYYHLPVNFPSCFFNCESLRSLKLKGGESYGIACPRSFGFSSLKTLHLARVRKIDGIIIAGCPNLETLTIEDVLMLESIANFNIHALNLKRLEILNGKYTRYQFQVMIFAPKLTNFRFYGFAPLVWSAVNFTSLEDVYVNLQNDDVIDDDSEQKLCLNLIKMLNEFHNARSLTLSMRTIEVLSKVPGALCEHQSPFTNLKYLKVKANHKDVTVPVSIVNYFLKSSALLKVCM